MTDSFESSSSLPPEVLKHYASGYESQRLLHGASQIELVRTQELVTRYVPPPPAMIFDVGGGPGMYACWLASPACGTRPAGFPSTTGRSSGRDRGR